MEGGIESVSEEDDLQSIGLKEDGTSPENVLNGGTVNLGDGPCVDNIASDAISEESKHMDSLSLEDKVSGTVCEDVYLRPDATCDGATNETDGAAGDTCSAEEELSDVGMYAVTLYY